MMIHTTAIHELRIVELKSIADRRGHFMRTFCAREFTRHGMNASVAQENLSFNHFRGTIRGLHFQVPPAAEAKVIRCTRGSIVSIVVDLRPESPTFLGHFAIELTDDNCRALYVPERFANGYQTLTDAAEATYYTTQFYEPGLERGLRFDDPTLGLPWPIADSTASDKDRSWPLLDDEKISAIRKDLSA